MIKFLTKKERKQSDKDDESRYFSIIRENSAIITKICYFYSDSEEDYQDLQQDVLASIWEHISDFKGNSKVSTWIYRLTLNTCISAFRKRKKHRNSIPITPLIDVADTSADIGEMYAEMHALIGRLKSEDKAILLLWLDDLAYQEISDIVGLPRNTIATRLKRIKEKIVEMANQ